MKKTIVLVGFIFLVGCSAGYQFHGKGIDGQSNLKKAEFLPGVSSNPTYGFTSQNPVNVGGGEETGRQNEIAYLSALFDSKGNEISYHQISSCCPEAVDSLSGDKMLHRFRINFKGGMKSEILYLNIWKYEQPYAPTGFTIKKARE